MASFEDIIRSTGEADDAKTAAAATLNELRGKIVNGEDSTGDLLTDGVIAIHGAEVLNPKYLETYRRLDEALKGQVGEPVLLVSFWRGRTHGCTGFGGRATYEQNRTVELGVLEGDSLVFDLARSTCFLPLSKYSRHEDRSKDCSIQDGSILVSGNQASGGLRNAVYNEVIIEVPSDSRLPRQLFDLFYRGLDDSERHYRLLILVGAERIKQLIEKTGLYEVEPVLRKMMLSLNQKPIMTEFTARNIEKEKALLAERKTRLLDEQEEAQTEIYEGQRRLDGLAQAIADIEAEEANLDTIKL